MTCIKAAPAYLVIAAVLASGGVAGASSPIEPKQSLSADGKYKARVSAPDYKGKTRSQLRLFSKMSDAWVEVWKVDIAYKSHPGELHVSNRGSVVTVGSWEFGRDAHALGVYKDGKLVKEHAPADLRRKYSKPEKRTPLAVRLDDSFTSLAGQHTWYGSYRCFDRDKRFFLWDDPTQTWIVVDLNNGSLIKPDKDAQRFFIEKARDDAYVQIKEKQGEHCLPYYRRLTRFLKPADKPIFEKLITHPDPNSFYGGHSSGPGDIYYFVANPYRELAEWALPAIESGNEDAIGDVRSFHKRTKYRHLGTLKISASFEEVPTSSDGIVILWLEPVDAGDETKSKRPDHTMGISLRMTVSKPLVMPVKMHFFGVIPGRYRVRGYWNKDIDAPFKVRQDYWKRSGQFVIVDPPEFEISKGESLGVGVLFKSTSSR